jgi:hypothetical protein
MELDRVAHHQIEGMLRQRGPQTRFIGDGEATHGLLHHLVRLQRLPLPAERVEDRAAEGIRGGEPKIAQGAHEVGRPRRGLEIFDARPGTEAGAPVEIL